MVLEAEPCQAGALSLSHRFKAFKFQVIHKVETGVRNMVIGTVSISELSTSVFKLSLEHTFLQFGIQMRLRLPDIFLNLSKSLLRDVGSQLVYLGAFFLKRNKQTKKTLLIMLSKNMHMYFLFCMLYLPYKYFFCRKFKGQVPYDSLYFSLLQHGSKVYRSFKKKYYGTLKFCFFKKNLSHKVEKECFLLLLFMSNQLYWLMGEKIIFSNSQFIVKTVEIMSLIYSQYYLFV